MGRKGGGLGLLVGIVKAIDRSNKEAERERLRHQRAALAQAKAQEKLYEQEKKRQDKEFLQSQSAQQKINKEREKEADDERRALEKGTIRLAKEKERHRIAETREIELKQKETQRGAALLAKEVIATELNEADAEFSLRCNQRKNLRLEYLRIILR